MRDLLIRGAEILPSAAHGALVRADILIRDGVITEIAAGVSDQPGVPSLDAAGCVAIPGLINAHLHSPGNLMRGTLDGYPLEVFMLYDVPPLADGPEEPLLVRLRKLFGAAEMLMLVIS